MQASLTLALASASVVFFSGVSLANAQPYTVSTPAGLAGLGGAADGTNSSAQFTAPAGLAMDSAGTVYLTDANAIRRCVPLGTNWVVTTLAGSIQVHGTSNGTNLAALFNFPQGLAVDAAGNLYVADSYNNAIRKVTPLGTNWVTTTAAGVPGPANSGSADGTNGTAQFFKPYGVCVDAAGTLFVADTYNHTIRKVAASGTNWVVTTLAGLAGSSGSANGTNQVARFNSPTATAVDTNGNLFVVDFGNNTIRKLAPSGTNWVVTTVAGSAGSSGFADGFGTAARFNQPQAITLDGAHNLYVTDSGNNTLRKITPAGTNWLVSTIAGLAGTSGSADGTGYRARFNSPYGIVGDGARDVFVGDSGNYTLREGRLAPAVQIARSANQAILSWSFGLTGYQLQTSTNLPATSWTFLTNGVVITNDSFIFTNTLQPGPAFYRLRK